jgi:hypothetical protein
MNWGDWEFSRGTEENPERLSLAVRIGPENGFIHAEHIFTKRSADPVRCAPGSDDAFSIDGKRHFTTLGEGIGINVDLVWAIGTDASGASEFSLELDYRTANPSMSAAQ